jgi:ATP-binding cassette, subfamily B, bacterial MsbA
MFNDTMANNISLGDDKPDAKRLADAVKAAHLEDVVAQLPHGLATICGHNAAQLSGGQKQRLAIARAIYKDAPILLLDEATSALDNESERAVQMALQNLMRNRTTVVVAHRLSTIQHADRIVVMAGGSIVEMGSHKALIEHNQQYAKLYKLSQHQS